MSDAFGWLAALFALLPGMGTAQPPEWSGYVEADYVYVAPVAPGTVLTLSVSEQQRVNKGDLLVVLSALQQSAALDAAQARVTAAEANLHNLESGSRTEEIDVVRASLARAEADRVLAEQNLTRSQKLFDEGLIPNAQVDQARAAFASAEAQVDQLRAQLAVAELPARSQQQIAAQASLDAAIADAAKARADLFERNLGAPVAGLVERIYFDPGEMAVSGAPVVALRPDGALKVKFFVPETARATLALGQGLSVSCDGCHDGLTATLSFLASEPQFTAPIIYSRDERGRLVYLAEARLDGEVALQPGQPVSVAVRP